MGVKLGAIAVQAIREWNPFGPEAIQRRAGNKAFRKAWRKRRRGEILTPEEEELVAQETVTVILPGGETIQREEPIIKKRTSTKVAIVGAIAPLLSVVPFWDEINGMLMQACQSEQGPAVFLAGAGVTWLAAVVTARLTKSPAVPGKL